MKKRLKIPLKDYFELNGIALKEDEKQIVINGIPINYVACLNGDIYSYQMDCENPKKLKPIIIDRPENNKHNMETYNPDLLYRGVNLVVNGKEKLFYWHIIIAKTFIPNDDPEHKTQVNHKEGDMKSDNSIWNLEWVSNRTNIIHARDHGLRDKTMKINRDRALELCTLIAKSKSTEYILNEFGIHDKTTRKEYIKRMSGIRRGKIWKDVYEEAQRIVSNEGSTTIERVG